nr:hypothetical protein [Tanacetum cinerariifolium]
QTTTGKEISSPFMADSLPKTILTTFIHDNDVTKMQALVDKKKVVVTEVAIRDVLWLDDAKRVDCLPNKEIFAELVGMGYEKPGTKLTFYKAFFSSQWKFLIHTILQSMSAKRTSWNEFSSAMTSAVICLSTEKGFSRVETPLFEGMLVGQEIEEGGDEEEHIEDVTTGDDAQEDVTAGQGDDAQEPSIPSPTPPTPPPQLPQDLPSTSQALEIKKLKRRVKKLEKGNRVRVLKLRRLKRIGTSQGIDTSDDTVMDDESNQGRIIHEMDKDDVVDLMNDKEEDKKDAEAKASKVLRMQEDEPAKVQEVVDVVTTTKLITEVVTAASETVTAASIIISAAEPQVPTAIIIAAPAKVAAAPSRRRKGVVIRDLEEESTTSLIISAETKYKDKCKGILVGEPKPLKKKQQMEEEEGRALQSINETLAQKAAKRRKLNEEVEDLKRHLEIVPDEDDDVYTEATPLARNVPVNFDGEDLEALWSLVKEMFSTSKPKNFSDDFLLTTLGAMFEKPDGQAQVWKNQRTIHGQAKVKSWKLLESCGVHIITFSTTQLSLLVERRYILSSAAGEELSAAKQKLIVLDSAAEGRLMLLLS